MITNPLFSVKKFENCTLLVGRAHFIQRLFQKVTTFDAVKTCDHPHTLPKKKNVKSFLHNHVVFVVSIYPILCVVFYVSLNHSIHCRCVKTLNAEVLCVQFLCSSIQKKWHRKGETNARKYNQITIYQSPMSHILREKNLLGKKATKKKKFKLFYR